MELTPLEKATSALVRSYSAKCPPNAEQGITAGIYDTVLVKHHLPQPWPSCQPRGPAACPAGSFLLRAGEHCELLRRRPSMPSGHRRNFLPLPASARPAAKRAVGSIVPWFSRRL